MNEIDILKRISVNIRVDITLQPNIKFVREMKNSNIKKVF